MFKRFLDTLRRLFSRRRSAVSADSESKSLLLTKKKVADIQAVINLLGTSAADEEIIRGDHDFTVTSVSESAPISVDLKAKGIVFIGGSAKDPMARIIKGASMEMPVIFGPQVADTDEAYEILSIGGALTADNPATFGRIVDRLLHDPEEYRRRTAWIAEWLEYHNRPRD